MGVGDRNSRPIPTLVDSINDVIMISAGYNHSACITTSYQVHTWGLGDNGRLGHGFDTTQVSPLKIDQLENEKITQVSCGMDFTIFVDIKGAVFGCGNSDSGKLSQHSPSRDPYVASPILISTKNDFNQIFEVSSGFNHSLALKNNGSILSFGSSMYGKLGVGRLYVDYIARPRIIYIGNKKEMFFTNPDSEVDIESVLPIRKQKISYQFREAKFAENKDDKFAIIDVAVCTGKNTFFRTSDGRVMAIGLSDTDGRANRIPVQHKTKKDHTYSNIMEPAWPEIVSGLPSKIIY